MCQVFLYCTQLTTRGQAMSTGAKTSIANTSHTHMRRQGVEMKNWVGGCDCEVQFDLDFVKVIRAHKTSTHSALPAGR